MKLNKSKKSEENENTQSQVIPSQIDYNKVIYFLDQNTKRYQYMSSGIHNLSGYSIEELNKIGFKSIVKQVISGKRNSFKSNGEQKEIVEEFNATYLIETKDKHNKWIEDNAFSKIDGNGKRIFSVGVLRDVTEFRRSINNLLDDKRRFQAILQLADVIFLMIDRNKKITLINEKGCEIFGVNNIVGCEYEILITSKIEDNSIDLFREFLNPFSNGNRKLELKLNKSQVEEYLINWNKTILKDENNRITSIVVSGEDITEKKKEENIQKVISHILQTANKVRNLDELFKFIHKSISELMLVENFYIAFHDKENDLISFPYFIDKYDDEAPPVKFGNGLTELVIKKGESALVDKAMDDELVTKGEIELIGTQSEIWLGVPLKIKNHTIGALVVQDYENKFTYTERHKEILEAISHPISMAIERKRVEQEREKLIRKLSELNQSKDRLFSLISHDLRSPFNSLLGFSEILTSEYDSLTDDEIKEYLNVIFESSKNLYGMTNNLLQYSRFQTGRIEYKPEKFDLGTFINSNANLLSGNIVKKEISFRVDADPDSYIFADEDMVGSAIQNLISNAVKFTSKRGKVTVSIRKKNQNSNSRVELIVEDTGSGISETDLLKISKGEMFSTPGTEREYGTGLGLVLIKEFVEKNGGELKIESEINKGSKFTCSFPSA